MYRWNKRLRALFVIFWFVPIGQFVIMDKTLWELVQLLLWCYWWLLGLWIIDG